MQTVTYNGKRITKERLEEEKKRAEQTPGRKIVEVAPGVYRSKLQD